MTTMSSVRFISAVYLIAASLMGCGSGTPASGNTAIAPSITTDPASQAVLSGQTATFSVVASGTAPLTYQWKHNDTAVSGATSASYTTPVTTISDSGSQYAVTVSNSAGNVTSNTATLTVTASTPTASILSIGFSPKLLQFTWTAATGATFYRLLRNPDGVSPFTAVGADIAAPAAGTDLDIAVFRQNWALARYALDACNTAGCTRSNEVTISAGMLAAIGYFNSPSAYSSLFGSSVALSNDGKTLAVGAMADDSSATGINGNSADVSASLSGAVWVFTRSTSGVWLQQAYVKASNTDEDDQFGQSVALSGDGDTLAVGATGESSAATGINGDQVDNSAFASGAVYVFARAGGVWSQQAYVKASNTEGGDATAFYAPGDIFGYSVALSGDGNTLAVGAMFEDSSATGIDGDQADNSAGNSGAVYAFTRIGGMWSQQAYIKASNTAGGELFGYSVALSSDGNTLAVGALNESSNAREAGAGYVFTRSNGVWSQQSYLKASNTSAGQSFGGSIALSSDGNTLAVGAASEDSAATGIDGNQADNSAANAGAVYVFTRTSEAWSQQAYVKASNTEAGDGFGFSVTLSGDGNTLAVGAIGEDSAAKGIGGNPADNSAANSGATYVFTRASGDWSQQAYVKASNTEAGDAFGFSMALSGDGNTLVVGSTAVLGAVYIY